MTDNTEEPFLSPGEAYWENVDVNDCGNALRYLEREAHTSVVNALRAKGPPSEHTFLLLNQLRSALSINDELGRAEIRRAAFDPRLAKISNVLNPNYDTCAEWSTCALESNGLVESRPSKGRPFANTTTTSIADQLLSLANTNNEQIDRSKGKIFEMLSIPHKPYVPERLRLLLRETDRAEERIPHPLEAPPPPPTLPAATPAEKSTRADGRLSSVKKRRQRITKRMKEKETPSELKSQTSPKREDGSCVDPLSDNVAPSSTIPSTPLVVNGGINSVMGSAGSGIISPGQPPQSGDAMKTWVSKIHDEIAASAGRNGGGGGGGGVATAQEEEIVPSTSIPIEDAKKKRRARTSVQDALHLNSCARTRPFQFEPANGKLKPPRGNPDKRLIPKRPSPGRLSVPSPNAPTIIINSVKPHDADFRMVITPPPPARASPVGHGSGVAGGLVGGYDRSTGIRSISQQFPNSQLKRPIAPPNPSRIPAKYFVNNSGVAVAASPNSMRNPLNTGGIGGRTASLGSQSLTSLHSGIHSMGHKASPSISNSSINSGGSMGSGIGGSSSCSSVLSPDVHQPQAAMNPEGFGGHDYSSPMVHPSSISDATGGHSQSSAAMRDPTGGLRLPPRVIPRTRLMNELLASPCLNPKTRAFISAGVSPTLPPTPSSPSPSILLNRRGSMSSIRPRAPSRGAVQSTPAVIVPTGERIVTNANDPVTDGLVQATVNNIMREAAQKESLNGKRSREILERENGALHGHSSVHSHPSHSSLAAPSSSHPYPVCRPSTEATTTSPQISTGLGSTGMTRQIGSSSPNRSSHPTGDSTVSPSHPPTTTTVCIPSHLIHTNVSMESTAPSNQPPSHYSGVAQHSQGDMGGRLHQFWTQVTADIAANGKGGNPIERLNSFMLAANTVDASVPSSAPPPVPLSVPPPPPAADTPSTEAAAATETTPRLTQRQFVLQPHDMSYAEFNVDNPMSYKSFASDGTPVQYAVSQEELYDQGVLARPSTSGLGGGAVGVGGGGGGGGGGGSASIGGIAGIGGFPGMRSVLQQSRTCLDPLSAALIHLQFGVNSSFSIPSSSGSGTNGEMSPATRNAMLAQLSQLQQIRQTATPSGQERTSSDVKDILEESCRELR